MAKSEKKDKQGFTDEEKAAMKERAKELKAEARANKNKAEGESDVLAKIDEMPESERGIAKRLHEIVRENAPDLMPKLWYGMPSYARDGKIVCFYQSAEKFGTRYGTFGFNDSATIDDGNTWPTAYAVVKLGEAEEKKFAALVKKAVSEGDKS
jgi:uncharacterized protein YdhG (YjbR/CyaY superfamily)